ncbi:MAG TPA: ribosome biogenesis GTPase Der [Vicinamibacterales bacterium]|nr:ribosome biogenesis GTPase Der [Vicinamibacterales bacterium]
MARTLPAVVLVGRPNVGKSTLFNRLTRTRRAIVTAIPGTTRDVIAQRAEWQGAHFELTDTGGMFGASEDPLHELVLERGRRAIVDADLLVFVVDGREGLVPGDAEIARVVREAGKAAVLAINKSDDRRARAGAMEFFQLGFEPVFEISAEHGEGVGDLLEAIVARVGKRIDPGESAGRDPSGPVDNGMTDAANEPEVSIAIIGRPNAGKSSLVNRLLREERMIVSEMPGTTRDSVDTVLTWHRRKFRIVDTAGIRRPGRVARGGQVESISVLLARRSIESVDIVVLVVDAAQGATDQDATIAGEADRLGKGIIIAANKWDLMKENGPDFVKEFDEALRRQVKFLDYAPVLHISARTGERASKLLEMIDRVAASRRQRVTTGDLNRFVERITAQHPPVSPGHRHVRVMYAAQTNVAPPTFVFFTNVATSFHFSYLRYLENRIRDEFGFMGSPIRIQVRARRRDGPDAKDADAVAGSKKGTPGGVKVKTRRRVGAGPRARAKKRVGAGVQTRPKKPVGARVQTRAASKRHKKPS